MCTASILNLCAISLDRYVAVTRPVTYPSIMSTKRAKALIAGIWVLSFVICFPPLVGWKDQKVRFLIKNIFRALIYSYEIETIELLATHTMAHKRDMFYIIRNKCYSVMGMVLYHNDVVVLLQCAKYLCWFLGNLVGYCELLHFVLCLWVFRCAMNEHFSGGILENQNGVINILYKI